MSNSAPSRELIQRALAAVQADSDGEQVHGRAYIAGVIATLRWALGERPEPPLSKTIRDEPPTPAEVFKEAQLAYDLMRNPRMQADYPVIDAVGPQYMTGVENTAYWVGRGDGLYLQDIL